MGGSGRPKGTRRAPEKKTIWVQWQEKSWVGKRVMQMSNSDVLNNIMTNCINEYNCIHVNNIKTNIKTRFQRLQQGLLLSLLYGRNSGKEKGDNYKYSDKLSKRF